MTFPSPPPKALVIDSVTVVDSSPDSDPRVTFSGAFDSSEESTSLGGLPASIMLVAARQNLVGTITLQNGRWQATVSLLVSNWQGPFLPARSGRYVFEACDPNGNRMALRNSAEPPASQLLVDVCRVSWVCSDSSIDLLLAAPLSDRERGAAQQAALESDYRVAQFEPENAVFFESFFGQNASCNPLAIDRALARARPDIRRYWSVSDRSVSVPEGAIALLEGSAQWWRIRGSARLLVVNDWLRKRLRKRKYQTVLQTWHGTMLKRLALSRRRVGLRPAIATFLESSRWDILLAQNPYSRKIFRSAYAYTGVVWEEGYPRDDILASGDASAVRTRLGIPQDVTVLLYAPTWRDDHPDQVDHLDVARFAELMGEGYVTLIRGHSRTLLPGFNVRAPRVIDVTGYPDVSELFLVADTLITDYSSVMFDFTVTGKPVFFFTPDLAHYREKLRGFYFDLLPVAPGPVVSSVDELSTLVRERNSIAGGYADRYRAWRLRFNPRDDGRAADRVVARLLAEGIVK